MYGVFMMNMLLYMLLFIYKDGLV